MIHSTGYLRLAADEVNSTVTLQTSLLRFYLPANGSAAFDFLVVFQTAAITTGIQLALTGPTSPAMVAALIQVPSSATAFSSQFVSAYDAGPLTTGIDVANAARFARMVGIIRAGASAGELGLRFRSEVAGSAVTVKAGSTVLVMP